MIMFSTSWACPCSLRGTHSLPHSLSFPLIPSTLSFPVTHSLSFPLIPSHSLSYPLIPSHTLTPSLPHSLIPSFPHSLIPSFPLFPSLPHSLTPSLPHSLTPSLPLLALRPLAASYPLALSSRRVVLQRATTTSCVLTRGF